jgi:hypothetical protein
LDTEHQFVSHPDGSLESMNMTAVTAVPGFGIPVAPAPHRIAPRVAITRGRRTSPATYRRRRLLATALLLAVVAVTGKAGVALGGAPLATPERRPATSDVVVVRSGDTLWSLVTRAMPGADPRPIVDQLSAARDGAPLTPGEVVRLPDPR